MKGKKSSVINRVISWMLTFVMVCSVMVGVTITSPTYVAEGAVSKYTTPITERASEEETTTWKFLFVVPLTSTYTDDTTSLQGDTLSTDDVNLFKTYIVPNFEAAIKSYSLGYMTVESTIVTIDTLVADKCPYNAYGYWPNAEDVKEALLAGTGVTEVLGTLEDLNEYDQVCCAFVPDNSTNPEKSLAFNAAGLGGPRFADYKSGYTITRLAKGMDIQDHNKGILEQGFNIKEDGALDYFYYAELIVHEFMHCLEFWVNSDYPEHIRREMPTPDGCWDYYKYRDGFNLMNDFYINFFRGNIPVKVGSTKKWGMTPADYANHPAKYQGVKIGAVTIDTLDEWNELCTQVAFGADTSKAKLTLGANIDARGKEIYTMPEFEGTLDGAGYAIVGATLTGTGLIGTVKKGATVKDLLLIGVTLTNKSAYTAGLIAGYNYGTITGCGVTGSLTSGYYAGGIAGCNYNTPGENGSETKAVISNCFNGATVTATKVAGGMTSWNQGDVTNCYNYGIITAPDWGASIAYEGTVRNCYNLENTAMDNDNQGKAEIVTSEEMTSAEFVVKLNGGGSAFAAGNGYPTIAGVKYAYMTTGGSTLKLGDAKAEADAVVWAGGTATKLATVLKATKWVNSSNKKVSGSITWIIKNEPTEIEFSSAHKVTTKSDTIIATVSKGTVKGKAEGKAYVYAIDTGSMTAEVFVVQVKAAPTAVATYYDAENKDKITPDTVKYTSDTVPEGEKVRIYYVGTTGTAKKGDWRILEDEDLTYTLTVPTKYADYMMVTEDTEKGYFEVSVAEGAIAASNSKKAVKSFTASLSLKNDQTGKKTAFKLIVSNPVKTVTLDALEGTEATSDDSGMLVVTLGSAKNEKQTGKIKETIELYNESGIRNDATKVVRIPHPEQYSFNATGAITVLGKTSAEQNKVNLKLTDKNKNEYTITANKGTQPGTEAYFIIWHNSFGRTAGKGYQIVKVVVGEANHYTSMVLDAASEDRPNGTAWQGDAGKRHLWLPSATKAAQKFVVRETTELADSNKEATNFAKVYSLPCIDGFTISPNGEVVVTGALTAGQKKVTMKAVSGKVGEYTISAARGTPEGTEAYLMLYHNKNCYEVVSVTVGSPNKVASTSIDFAATGNVTGIENLVSLTEDEEDTYGKVYTLEVPSNTKAATKVVLTETQTASMNQDKKMTDVNMTYVIPAADAFTVLPNEAGCTVKGALTVAQKKITVKLTKNTTNYTITVAKGTPVGTEAYVLLYHNYEGDVSGTGYQLIRVVVTE